MDDNSKASESFIVSAVSPDHGDATITYFGGSKARLEVFSYMNSTIFHGSSAAFKDATWSQPGIFGEYLPNLRVEEDRPSIEVKDVSGAKEVTLSWVSPEDGWVEIQSSDDLVTWEKVTEGLAKSGSNTLKAGSYSSSSKYFRVVPSAVQGP